MAPPRPLQQLFGLDKSSPRFHDQLRDIIGGKEYRERVPRLRNNDVVRLVEYLDSVLDCPDPMAHAFRMPLYELGRICGAHETLPKSSTIPRYLQIDPPVDPGYAQTGTLDGAKVRIKCVRIYPKEHIRPAKKAFNQLAVVWTRLNHPNIAPILGVTIDPLQLVSKWMPRPDLVGYIENHSDADRLGLLYDVSKGLNYLHSCDMIHGGLKGPNILVNVDGRALITDFGLALVTQSLGSIWRATDECAHAVRWIAPEILDGWGTYSKEGDVFSLAMVTIEIFTGAVPFVGSEPTEALLSILRKKRPPRPTDQTFKDELWALIQRCWNQKVHLRPRMSEVLHDLRSFGVPTWRRLFSRPCTADERISLVTEIFSDSDEIHAVKCLSGDDAQAFIDVIDETLHSLPQPQQKECLKALRRICGRQGLLPSSLQISFSCDRSGVAPYGGGFADVWMGDYQGRKVAVKVPRAHTMKNREKITRRFCKEAVVWKTLHHRNVLSLLGATMANGQFAMVSEWMVNRSINEFIEAHRDVNRIELLKDVARGLVYMHDQGMIHGDLKGANILIDNDRHARLADFGLLTIISDPLDPTVSSSSAGGGTTRWMSPELLHPELFGLRDSQPTKESDCYALGMVIYEVLSRQVPFASSANAVVMRKVLDGERPKRPQGEEGVWFTDDLWKMTELCWVARPESRPSIEAVLECLGRVLWPLPSTGDKPSSARGSSSGRLIVQDRNQSSVLPHNYPSSVTSSPKSRRGKDVKAAPPLNSKESPRNIWGLTPEDPTKFPTQMASILDRKGTLRDGDWVRLVEYLDNVLGELDATSPEFRTCLRELRRTCGICQKLPQSYTLPGSVPSTDGQPIAWGYYGNVHKGFLNGSEVRVKRLFVSSGAAGQDETNNFYEEAVTWKYLKHPNIVSLLGNTITPSFQLISDWIPYGNLTEYIKVYPGADRLSLLCGVANGLEYLHSNDVAHGNLGVPNILVETSGQVRITDFGLAMMPRDPDSRRDFTDDQTTRWTAPEVLRGGLRSKEADVFAFAMVMIEVFTGEVPFHPSPPVPAMMAIMKGDRPPRPAHPACSNKLWGVVQRCWDQEPGLRPGVLGVLDVLRGVQGSRLIGT